MTDVEIAAGFVERTCAICIEPIEDASSSLPSIQTSCGHVYHQLCLREWIQTKNGCCCCWFCCEHVSIVYFPCPMCRGKQVSFGNRWIVDRRKFRCFDAFVDWLLGLRCLLQGQCTPNWAVAGMLMLYLSMFGLIYIGSLASMRLRPGNRGPTPNDPVYIFEDFD